jgi:hypothetical protein
MLTYAERLAKFLFESNRQQSASRAPTAGEGSAERHTPAYVSRRQHTPAYVSAGEGSGERSAADMSLVKSIGSTKLN